MHFTFCYCWWWATDLSWHECLHILTFQRVNLYDSMLCRIHVHLWISDCCQAVTGDKPPPPSPQRQPEVTPSPSPDSCVLVSCPLCRSQHRHWPADLPPHHWIWCSRLIECFCWWAHLYNYRYWCRLIFTQKSGWIFKKQIDVALNVAGSNLSLECL